MDIKLVNQDFTQEVIFDNINYVLNEKDFGFADIEVYTFQGLNQVGKHVSGKAVEMRDVSIVGYILADSEEEMRQKKRYLQSVVGIKEDFYIIVDNEYKLCCAATESINYGLKWYENCGLLCKFLIEATAANPCFTRVENVNKPFPYWKARFHFPFHVNAQNKVIFAERQNNFISNVENDGEIETGFTATIHASGTVVNPYILNIFTQEKFTINVTMNTGDELVVSTEYGNKKAELNGVSVFKNIDLDSDFFQLEKGENYIRCGAESGQNNLSVTMSYTPLYFEV